jgi:hypothetical protein
MLAYTDLPLGNYGKKLDQQACHQSFSNLTKEYK